MLGGALHNGRLLPAEKEPHYRVIGGRKTRIVSGEVTFPLEEGNMNLIGQLSVDPEV